MLELLLLMLLTSSFGVQGLRAANKTNEQPQNHLLMANSSIPSHRRNVRVCVCVC